MTQNITTESNKNVTIGYPCYDGKAKVEALATLMQGLYLPNRCINNIQFMNGDSLIPRARNKVAALFLDHGTDYLMFIDNDITFSLNDIERLRDHNVGVVGGVYLKKTIPYAPVSNRWVAQEGALTVMEEIGTGFMMIHRDVLLDIRKKFPEREFKRESDEPDIKSGYYDYFGVGVVDGRYLSEDYYFCYLAREAGYKIYYDQNVMVAHHGQFQFPCDDNNLIEGAAHLLEHYREDAKINETLVKRLHNVTKKQIETRNIALDEEPKKNSLVKIIGDNED